MLAASIPTGLDMITLAICPMAGSFTLAMWVVTGIVNSLLTVGAIIVLTIAGAVSPGSPVLSCSSASLISARLLVLLLAL